MHNYNYGWISLVLLNNQLEPMPIQMEVGTQNTSRAGDRLKLLVRIIHWHLELNSLKSQDSGDSYDK